MGINKNCKDLMIIKKNKIISVCFNAIYELELLFNTFVHTKGFFTMPTISAMGEM